MRSHRNFQKKQDDSQDYPHNEQITAPEVRLISDTGMLGVMPTSKAMEMAREQELDLVLISPKAVPPVAKIIAYSSFKYQQEKMARKMKAHAKQTETKSIRLSVRIGQHDLDVRVRQAVKFIGEGDKVKVEIYMRDRERQHADIAIKVMRSFIEDVQKEQQIKIESQVKRTGPRIEATFAPNK